MLAAGDYRYPGADLGVLVARSRMQTDDNELTEYAQRWIRGVHAQFASTPLEAPPEAAPVYAFNDSAPQLATMMGLGVGVDYALFIVTRHREGLRAGVPPPLAAAAATATSGSSVLWAGVTVVAAICGLAFAGIPVVTSLGFAAAIVVACSVAAALTLLPALLSLTGFIAMKVWFL